LPAQRLRQTPTYGFVWIASFIVSIILRRDVQPGSQAPIDAHAVDLFIVGMVFLIIGIVFILPSIAAFRCNHPNRWLISLSISLSAAPSTGNPPRKRPAPFDEPGSGGG
jgi:hypothetical protein